MKKAFIVTHLTGSYAMDEKGSLIDVVFFPKDPEEIAERISDRNSGNGTKEEKLLLERCEKKGMKAVVMEDGPLFDKIREGFRRIAKSRKYVKDDAEMNSLLSRISVALSGKAMKVQKKDRIIIQVIRIIDELDADLNSLTERTREWYGMYFPELGRQVKTHEKYLEMIGRFGEKERFSDIGSSVGMDFSGKDVEQVRTFSESLLGMYGSREELSRYLEGLCRDAIPNVSSVAGPLLGARLLSLSGGLEAMSKMPSSKIQLLGAEKALFRHLRGKGKAPKYGILFSHPMVQQAPKDKKGKIARLIASKISLASKVDQFSKKDRTEEIGKELERKAESILKG